MRLALFVAVAILGSSGVLAQAPLHLATWNIWHGGREDGEDVGPERVVEVLRASGADLIAMQETYGSGERISKGLGFNFHPRGTNVSILSRYPILEDLSVHDAFNCVGALIDTPGAGQVAFFSIWLPYSAEIWEAGTRDTGEPEKMLAACAASHTTLQELWKAIDERLAADKYDDVPVVIAGDFNSMSHLDYGEIGWDQYGVTLDWPTSHVLAQAGFVDTYRASRPKIDRAVDSTWTPRFPEQEQDRIDFIYARAPGWNIIDSTVLRTHEDGFPSDHAVLTTQMVPKPSAPAQATETALRTVTYNIRHGVGTDGELDLARTAKTLGELRADFVGLQEVDLAVERSRGINQAGALGEKLGLHPAFGSFMDYQGGRYGMAILSRHPIVQARSFRLPNGNEPRVALFVEARLPNGETVWVVNVHFDWVEDDTYRFAQATRLSEELASLQAPYLLLGDFNDTSGSRTLNLFEQTCLAANKPSSSRYTFPAPEPEKEIDFLFCFPREAWRVTDTQVVPERIASDHRPVLSNCVLRNER